MNRPDLLVVIAPDVAFRTVVCRWASSSSHRPLACATLLEGRAAISASDPALVVVAVDECAERLSQDVASLRSCSPDAPIVCLANLDDFATIVGHGATDVFSRASTMEEILARCAARTRRSEARVCPDGPPDPLERTCGVVRLGGKAIRLRAAPRKILDYLFRNAGRPVPVAEIQREVLRTAGRSHTVHNHVYEIRKAMTSAGLRDVIRTHRGYGCFSVSISWLERNAYESGTDVATIARRRGEDGPKDLKTI